LVAKRLFAIIYICYAGVAQLFRALPCQGRGQELESPYPHQIKMLSIRWAFYESETFYSAGHFRLCRTLSNLMRDPTEGREDYGRAVNTPVHEYRSQQAIAVVPQQVENYATEAGGKEDCT
jgi:hypothetical protein